MEKSNIKIGIVGAGSIGKVLSTTIKSLGYDVEVVCKRNHRQVMIDGAYDFEIYGDFGNKSMLVPAVYGMESFSSKKDIIIFATKTYDMLESVKDSLNYLSPDGTIVTIQNVFSIDKLRKLIPDSFSVCLICDFVCKTVDKITYVKNFGGFTLGVYNKDAFNKMMMLKDILSQIASVNITKDIFGFTMGRNILNGAISALGGVSGLRLKDILEDKNGKYLFCEIIKEAYSICRRYRIKVLPYNDSLDYNEFVNDGFKGKVYRSKILKALKVNNGDIKSSALDDLENGKKTELRYMLDSLMSYGKKTRTQIKYLSILNNMIDEIEQGKRVITANAFVEIMQNN